MPPKTLAIIPARGGSQGIPRKNLALLQGKPLIAWTIEAARAVPELDTIVVSTDDEEIAAVASHWGAWVPFRRPAKLAQADSSMIDVVLHALEWLAEHHNYRPDLVLLLQPTSPFRTVQDILNALELMRRVDAPAVVSVTPCQPHPFLTFKIDRQGHLEQLWQENISNVRRQDLPPVYQLNGAIYLIKTPILLQQRSFVPRGTYALVMPRERSLDIDEPFDLILAQVIAERELWRKPSTSQAA
ncbi:MAG: acylneuraminate cytidylyltransferase family protein [Gemmatales bacterium]|nr:acylneuraminate cytidylyltransferase family protein [Gemmatales bacterium]MDW7995508.1 acylneuraminate cytidylyltransferase family protein [Gemmatales bacterium]